MLDSRHQPLIGHVDVLDLHPGRLPIQEVLALLLGVVADRLGRVDKARGRVEAVVPAARRVTWDGERTLGERLRVVEELAEVDIGDRAPAFAARTHAARSVEGHCHGFAGAAFYGDRTARADRRDVKGKRVGRADVRLSEAAEEDAQHRVGIGSGAYRRAGIGAHPLLIDDDGGRQPFEYVHLGPRQRRHEALNKGAVRLVDQPLRLSGDRIEHQ